MSSLALIIRSGLIWRALPPEEKVDNNNPAGRYQHKSPGREQFYPVSAKQCQDLHELCIERYQPPIRSRERLSFGVEQIDAHLPTPGLPAGTIHEWSLLNPLNERNTTPHSLFSWLAFRAWKQLQAQESTDLRFIFWIGREVWPSPHTLAQISQGENKKGAFFGQNIFLDVAGEKERLWSIESALRSSAAALVIVPLTTPSLTVSRRLLLAAERSGSIGLFSIPQHMRESTTASLSRWEVTPTPSSSDYSRWRLELKKWKGSHPERKSWEIELSPPSIHDIYFAGTERISGEVQHERTGAHTPRESTSSDAFSLHIPADVVDRALPEKITEDSELLRQIVQR